MEGTVIAPLLFTVALNEVCIPTFKSNYLESASTDGHRLAVALIGNEEHIKNKENLSSNVDDLSVTIPTRSLREIEKLVSLRSSENSIKLFYDKGQVVFISSNQIITTRTLEGTYPNYSQSVSYTHLTLPTSDLV